MKKPIIVTTTAMLKVLKRLVEDAEDRGETINEDTGELYEDWAMAIEAIKNAEEIKIQEPTPTQEGEEQRYLVTWEIDIYADSPEEAAQKAFYYMQKPDTTATVFEVTDSSGNTQEIDLQEEEEEEEEDLFLHPEKLPEDVIQIIEEFSKMERTYDNCQELVEHLKAVGYTCDYYLDANPFNLHKL